MNIRKFVSMIMTKINNGKEIIQNEYAFQNLFYFYSRDVFIKDPQYKDYKIYPEIHLCGGVMGTRERIDFIIIDTQAKEYYVIELKCKTNKKTLTIYSGFDIDCGANTSVGTGSTQIANDINRINLLRKSKYYGSGYKFVDGLVVLLTDVKGYASKEFKFIKSLPNINNNGGNGNFVYYFC